LPGLSGRPRMCPTNASRLRLFVPVLCPRGMSPRRPTSHTNQLDQDAAVFQPLFCGVLEHCMWCPRGPPTELLRLGHLGHRFRATVPGLCPGQSRVWDSGTAGTTSAWEPTCHAWRGQAGGVLSPLSCVLEGRFLDGCGGGLEPPTSRSSVRQRSGTTGQASFPDSYAQRTGTAADRVRCGHARSLGARTIRRWTWHERPVTGQLPFRPVLGLDEPSVERLAMDLR
jgi:hypothetical protein